MNILSSHIEKRVKPNIEKGFGFIKNTMKMFSQKVSDVLDGVFRPYQHNSLDAQKTNTFKE